MRAPLLPGNNRDDEERGEGLRQDALTQTSNGSMPSGSPQDTSSTLNTTVQTSHVNRPYRGPVNILCTFLMVFLRLALLGVALIDGMALTAGATSLISFFWLDKFSCAGENELACYLCDSLQPTDFNDEMAFNVTNSTTLLAGAIVCKWNDTSYKFSMSGLLLGVGLALPAFFYQALKSICKFNEMPKIENAFYLLSLSIVFGLFNLAVLSGLYHYKNTLTDLCEPTVLDVFGVITLDGLGSSEKEGCRTFTGSVEQANQNTEKFPGTLRRSVGFLSLGILLLSLPTMLVICVVDLCLLKILFPRPNSSSQIWSDIMSNIGMQNNHHQSSDRGDDEPTSSNGSDDPEPPSADGTLVVLNPLRFVITRLWLLEQQRSKDRRVNESNSSEGKFYEGGAEDPQILPVIA